jgi:DNA-directed RNA polymerase subunit M/transcription elongation factor TFIIS
MRGVLDGSLVAAFVLLVSSVFAEEAITPETYIDFLKPFEGHWTMKGESGGAVFDGVWTIKRSPIAACFLTHGGDTETGAFQSLDGYDVGTKKYTIASFRSGGVFTLAKYKFQEVKEGHRYGKGWISRSESTSWNSDGTTRTRSSTMTCLKCDDEGMVLEFSQRTEDAESKPNNKLTLKRQSHEQKLPKPPVADPASDADQLTAQDYMDYFKPFVGSWKTKLESGGETVEGMWSGYLAPTKTCYISQSTGVGQPAFQGIDGYDAGTKTWTVASFNTDGEFTLTRIDPGDIKKGQRFGKGATGTSVESTSKEDGTTTEMTLKFTCKECTDNRIVYVLSNRKENGEPKPDLTYTMVGQAHK